MVVITHVNQFSQWCVTSACECHPKRRITGAPRWVRQAQIDYHEALHFGITPQAYEVFRANQ